MFHSLRSRVAFAYIALLTVAILAITAGFLTILRDFYLADLEQKLVAQARLVGDLAAPALARGEGIEALDPTIKHWGELLGARITLIRADGVVLGDSYEDPRRMENHANRPEVRQALQSGQGAARRYSTTVGYEMLYAAVAIWEGDHLLGVARVALPLSQINATLGTVRRAALIAVLITGVAALIVAAVVAEGTLRPVRALTQMARRLAEGDLSARLPLAAEDEVGSLTQALNRMAARLQGMMETLARERAELATILSHLTDGLLITDAQGQVTRMNPAAGRILGLPSHKGAGRSLVEVVRDHEIVEVWQHAREGGQSLTRPVEKGSTFLQVTAAPIPHVGYLLLLQDLTEVRRLTTIRRDFVANVSHELRTPLASLKMLTETLQSGALEDPSAARHFLKRIDEELDRLIQLVQELLELSHLESGKVSWQMAPEALGEIAAQAVERLRPQIERAGLNLIVDLPDDLPPVLADAERMEQVMVNLLHNAIKFTPAGSIRVRSCGLRVRGDGFENLSPVPYPSSSVLLPEGDWVVVSVSDTGVGIPAEDLPRIFERFYKADRARSGGGTGLGLAIVKHTIEAHNGRSWAESMEGEGSTFYVALPALTSP